MRTKELLTGWLTLFVFIGSFFIAEFALRLVQINKFGAIEEVGKGNKFYVDEVTHLRLPHPNQQLGIVKINNHGFRGPDISKLKEDNTVRIAFLGSSTTYDSNVKEKNNWPHQTLYKLENLIQGCEIEFINAGLPGYDTKRMLDYWKYKVSNFNIDLVIILPGDMTGDIQISARQKGFKGYVKNQVWLSQYSILWAKIEKNFNVIRAQRQAFNEKGKYQPDIEALAGDFGDQLIILIKDIQKSKKLVIVPTISNHLREELSSEYLIKAAGSALYYMPYVSIPTILEAQEAYNKKIREVVKESGVLLVENENQVPADSTHFVDSRHFTKNGADKMSGRVVSTIINSQAFWNYISRNKYACKLKE